MTGIQDESSAMAERFLSLLPKPRIGEGGAVAFKSDGSNVLLCEVYDDEGLLVVETHRVWIESELIRGEE